MTYVPLALFAVTALICTSFVVAQREECGPNEIRRPCARRCEVRCNAPRSPSCRPSPQRCEGPVSCGCRDGYARDPESNRCVAIRHCPANECGVGEVKALCGPRCEGTCDRPSRPRDCRPENCTTRRCRCDLDGGFLRGRNGRCMRREECH